jgi:hypothetical protein
LGFVFLSPRNQYNNFERDGMDTTHTHTHTHTPSCKDISSQMKRLALILSHLKGNHLRKRKENKFLLSLCQPLFIRKEGGGRGGHGHEFDREIQQKVVVGKELVYV